MSEEFDESPYPERDALWAKHDGLTPALCAELLVLAGQLELERNTWKHETELLRHQLRSEQENAIDWFIGYQELKAAIADTLEENKGCSYGDSCGLKKLKDAYAKAKAAESGLDSENDQRHPVGRERHDNEA